MRRWWTVASVLLVLAVLGGWLPRLGEEVSFYRANVLPLLRLWPQPEQQAELAAAPARADVLLQADRVLPIDATVVFLTAGKDVDSAEYIAFHRALYDLSPRPVWWVVQAPDPPTERQPRWFQTSVPADTQWLLAYEVEPPAGQTVADLGDGSSLVWLGPGPAPPATERATTLWAAPTWPLQAALALLTVLVAGAAILAGIQRTWNWRPTHAEALVLAWPLGSVAITLGLLLGCAVGLGLRSTSAALAIVAWASCMWFSCRALVAMRSTRPAFRWPGGRTPSSLACIALAGGLALIVVYVGLLADGRPLQVWDSWVTWGMKARLIWQTDTIPTGVYADPTRAVTLLDYPLLVPLLEAWLYTWLGAPDDRLAGLVNVVSYAALLGLAGTALRARGANVLLGLLAGAYLASIWALAGLAGLAFADVPLAVFALLAGVYLVRWLEGGSPATLVIAAIAAGALGWTKREGLVLLALLILAGLLGARGSRRWAAPALALGGLVIAGPWLAFVAWRGLPDWQFMPISLQTALDNRERLSFVFGTLGRWSVGLGSDWSLPSVWLLGLAALGLSLARRGIRVADLLPLVGAAYLLLMSTAYLFSAFVPYQTHVLASLSRLMAHVAPAVGVWLVSRWLEVRPGVARLPRRRPADAAPASPPGSSTDRRTPALEGLGTASGATLRPPPRPGTRPD